MKNSYGFQGRIAASQSVADADTLYLASIGQHPEYELDGTGALKPKVEREIVHQYKRGDMVRYWAHNKQEDVIVSRVVHGRIESQGRAGSEPMYYIYEGNKVQRLVSEQNIIGASAIAAPVGQSYVTSKYLTVSVETSRGVLTAKQVKRILKAG